MNIKNKYTALSKNIIIFMTIHNNLLLCFSIMLIIKSKLLCKVNVYSNYATEIKYNIELDIFALIATRQIHPSY